MPWTHRIADGIRGIQRSIPLSCCPCRPSAFRKGRFPKLCKYYHSTDSCPSIRSQYLPLTPFTYGELEEGGFAKLTACPYCVPARRRAEIDEINALYAPGGDHEELLNSLRKDYYEYLAQE